MDTVLILKKFHGMGNDYLVIDPNKNDVKLTEGLIQQICKRNIGVGSDGILYGPTFENNNINLKIYNSDGSPALQSGNGLCIFAKYLIREGYIKTSNISILTDSGINNISFLDSDSDVMRVDMGKPSYQANAIPARGVTGELVNIPLRFNGFDYICTCLSVGNPHCTIWMKDISKELVQKLGPYVESSKYFPNKVNLELMKIVDRYNINIEIYERGSGYTLASGTSACAAAAAAYRIGEINSNVRVHMPGGNLNIEISPDDNIFMTGKVEYIGEIYLSKDFFS